MLLFDLLQEFVFELIRTLLIEELSRRVRSAGERRRAIRRRRRIVRRAIHRMTTDRRADL